MIIKSRYWLWLLALAPVALGLTRLRFDTDVLDLLPSGVRAVQGLKLYQEHFANARELILTIQSPDADETEAAARLFAETLRGQTNLVEQAVWQPPWLEHPGGATDFLAYLWFNQPPEVFSQLTNRLSPPSLAASFADAREQLATSLSPDALARLSYDPLGLTRLPEAVSAAAPNFNSGREIFASTDGTFRVVFVRAPSNMPTTYRACIRWLARVKQIVRQTQSLNHLSPKIQVNFTGQPAFVAETSSGMQSDMAKSVGATVFVIVLLFWWAHRRWRPLLWLLTLLAGALAGTLGLGGLLFGKLNVVSTGFAAILLGLAVDYGLVLYQESLYEPHASVTQLRRAVGPGIFWSAVTTAGAFLMLNFGGMPGLAQLGTLVALGVCLGATVMVSAFLPPLMRGRIHLKGHGTTPASASRAMINFSNPNVGWALTAAILFLAALALMSGLPRLDHSSGALRPSHSEAYAALEKIQGELGRSQASCWLVVGGTDAASVARRLSEVQPILERAQSNRWVDAFNLPTAIWPRPQFEAANRTAAGQLARANPALLQAAAVNGFSTNSIALAEHMLVAWKKMAATTNIFWPSDPVTDWVMGKVVARSATHFYALGLVYPSTNRVSAASGIETLESQLPGRQVWLAGWEQLAYALLGIVERDFWHVMLPMIALLLISLWLAFRSVTEVSLSLVTLAFSLVCLLALMKLAGWSWNLLNLMALPLLLGAGVDYSIHTQLALRRHHGDIPTARRTVGRALLLCAATTVAGFGSNAWSSNRGLVSLGQVCAAGIAFAYLSANFLLPIWWRTFVGGSPRIEGPQRQPANDAEVVGSHARGPSFLYRSGFWRLGLWIVRLLPRAVCQCLSRRITGVYWRLARHRRAIVIRNLVPPLNGDRAAAKIKAKRLFQEFGLKLVDLWRYEAGLPIENLFAESSGWEHFIQAKAQGRGVLLLTPHLGNWEFGGPWLARRGIQLQVVTLAEPGGSFTELRRAARARWNIETVVIRNDPFAFVEIIRRLESGATVALLMDRPPPATAVTVNLFGQPFSASIAAAELARASGCALLPVYLPRNGNGYAAHVLPAITYDRAALRDRAARQQLTQNIVSAFEPIICQHLEQWFHFVPVWQK